MHLHSVFFTLLSLTSFSLSSAPSPPLQTLIVHSLPSTSSLSSPAEPIATLNYSPEHPHLSKISSFSPPTRPKDEDALIQIGVCFDGNKECRTTATMTKSFHPPYKGRFRIVTNKEGEVLSVSWRAWLSSSSTSSAVEDNEGKYQPGGKGDFDVVVQSQAPGVWVDKPVTKGKGKGRAGGGKAEEEKKEGEEEEVDERSFLQKYWWVILAVTIFAMAGGGPDK
ncbi:MAG: hypothetical protein Q9166_007480 [cf. Caloplaca sp. 2 TL-2023]